jgi:polysaccharide biosynthesis protein PslG
LKRNLSQILFFLPLTLGLLFLVGSMGITITQGDKPEFVANPFDPFPQKVYPNVTDLGTDAEIDESFASLSYGIHTFLWWNGSYRSWDLENIRLMNFVYVKQSFAWEAIQPAPDHWDWSLADEVIAEAEYRGRRVVARIDDPPEWAVVPNDPRHPPYDMPALETFCRELATRYAGKIEAYQIWNEPNLTREWGDQIPYPSAYVEFLATCATAIRQADPQAIIISAGLSPTGSRDYSAIPDEEYLWRMYEAGAAQYFDVLGVHAPGYSLPPEASREDAAAAEQERWARFRHVEDMRAIMVANGDAHKQIAIMEMGWTTDNREDSIYSWFGVSEDVQADYLVRAYAYAAENWRPWVGLVTVIYMSKDIWTEDDEQYWWAIDEPADPPIWKRLRPAYYALANMEKISDNPEFSEAARDPNEIIEIEPLPPRN